MIKKVKLKNVSSIPRKFRDNCSGKEIIVQPGEIVVTSRPVENKYFMIEKIEEKKKKKFIRRIKEDGRRCMDGDMSSIDQ